MTVSYNPFDPEQVDHDEEVLTQLRNEARIAELMPGLFYVTPTKTSPRMRPRCQAVPTSAVPPNGRRHPNARRAAAR